MYIQTPCDVLFGAQDKKKKRGVFNCMVHYARLDQFKNQLSLYCPLVDSKKYLTLRELDAQK